MDCPEKFHTFGILNCKLQSWIILTYHQEKVTSNNNSSNVFINSWFILKPHRTQSFKNSISCEDFNVQKKELTFPPRRTNEHTEILSHECLKLPLHMKATVRGWECVRLWERLSVWDRLLLQPSDQPLSAPLVLLITAEHLTFFHYPPPPPSLHCYSSACWDV